MRNIAENQVARGLGMSETRRVYDDENSVKEIQLLRSKMQKIFRSDWAKKHAIEFICMCNSYFPLLQDSKVT